MAATSTFSGATAVKALSSHTYEANFPSDWCIGSVPHGGFVTACFMRVAALHFATTLAAQKQAHAITVHLEFLRRTEVGPALFTVKDVKLGRQTSTIHITLSQSVGGDNRREEVVGYLTHSNLESERGPTFDTQWKLSDPEPQALAGPASQCLGRGGGDDDIADDPAWRLVEDMPFASFRKAASKLDFFLPRRGHPAPGTIDQWVRFSAAAGGMGKSGRGSQEPQQVQNNVERFTNESLGYVCDCFPQIIEILASPPGQDPYSMTNSSSNSNSKSKEKQQQQQKQDNEGEAQPDVAGLYWYPTVLLNLDIKKALPADGVDWLFVRLRSKQVRNGRYDLEIVIQDEAGELVALSHHVCLVVPATRNVAKRSSSSSSLSPSPSSSSSSASSSADAAGAGAAQRSGRSFSKSKM